MYRGEAKEESFAFLGNQAFVSQRRAHQPP